MQGKAESHLQTGDGKCRDLTLLGINAGEMDWNPSRGVWPFFPRFISKACKVIMVPGCHCPMVTGHKHYDVDPTIVNLLHKTHLHGQTDCKSKWVLCACDSVRWHLELYWLEPCSKYALEFPHELLILACSRFTTEIWRQSGDWPPGTRYVFTEQLQLFYSMPLLSSTATIIHKHGFHSDRFCNTLTWSLSKLWLSLNRHRMYGKPQE